MHLTVVGCGDAFGSGGRLQTCFHVQWTGGVFLIDCGATALIGLNRLGLDPNVIDTVFVSHLHGDHFAGLVWFMLHAQHVAKREGPLTVAGPEGIEARFLAASEILFPKSTQIERRFALRFRELAERAPCEAGGVTVTPYPVEHPSGAPSYALRFELEGRTLAFSGDTQWVETLVEAGQGADLFICESYHWEGSPRFHMSYATLAANLDRIAPRRVLLSHMGEPMLARRDAVDDARVLLAEDGLAVEI